MLSSVPQPDGWKPVYNPEPAFEYAIRGQTPGYDEMPPSGAGGMPNGYAPGYSVPYNPGPQAYGPYSANPNEVSPYGPGQVPGAGSGYYSFGANGPQPYRMGWTSRYDIGFLPKEPTENGLGQLGIFEFNGEWQYTTPSAYNKVLSITPQFGLRSYDGPRSAPGLTTALPGEVYRVGIDFELSSPLGGPWSGQIAFNPSINTDFRGSLSSDAWQFDSRGIVFYNASRQLVYAIGAGFWDRIDDRVVPYAGVIWTPDDRWEYRLVFPEPRVSYFMGNVLGFSTWAYARGEWHIEAYELQLQTTRARERVELEDWRVLLGIRKTNGWISEFYEAGWVFGRKVDYAKGATGFDVSSGFIVRGGIQY